MPGRKAKKNSDRLNELQKKRLKDEKIECLVQEVENAFDQYKKEMWDAYEKAKCKALDEFNTYLRCLPEWLKNMPVKEAMEKNNDFKSLIYTKNERIDTKSILSKFMSRNIACGPKAKLKSASKEPLTLSKKKKSIDKRKSILAKKIRASSSRRSKILPTHSRKTSKNQVSADDSYVDISEDEVFLTPSQKNVLRPGIITPKFDISKPVLRSQLRRAKPGEVGVSLSGSPLLYEKDANTTMPRSMSEKLQVSVGKKMYHFSEPETLKRRPSANERKQIIELRKKLDQILKK